MLFLLITKFDLARDTSAEGSHTVYGICAFARIPFRVFCFLSQQLAKLGDIPIGDILYLFFIIVRRGVVYAINLHTA